MLSIEYQIPMPVTVDEYRIGLLYMVAKSSMEDSGAKSGTGVEFVKNEPYVENDHNLPPGQYTEKVYFIRSYLPKFLAALLPESAASIIEYSWNAFPRCKTEYYVPFFGNKLHLSVESVYLPDSTPRANALGLSKAELAQRTVSTLDIASAEFVALPTNACDDPTRFQSRETGRGRLSASKWFKDHKPLIYAYKLVRLEFKKLGLQTKYVNFSLPTTRVPPFEFVRTFFLHLYYSFRELTLL
mmetsp:Transcript_5056/g.10705  ORF Transcript_5056/g.10705 Transcript_5056/m.10705 type:complete len:242 (+) Transcript_5056:203-928(+)